MTLNCLIDRFKLDKQEFYFQFNSHPDILQLWLTN